MDLKIRRYLLPSCIDTGICPISNCVVAFSAVLCRSVECCLLDDLAVLVDPFCFHVLACLIECMEPFELVFGIKRKTWMRISPIMAWSAYVLIIVWVVCTVPGREDSELIDAPTHNGVVLFDFLLLRGIHHTSAENLSSLAVRKLENHG